MSNDGISEQNAIEARLKALVGGRVTSFMPEEAQLAIDTASGLILPYIVVSFGSFSPVEGDRSIEGEEQQPNFMPVIVECWASNGPAARATAGAVRTLMIGWSPDANNATELAPRGGGWFQKNDAGGRPIRFMESVNLVTELNMSIIAP